MFSGRNFAFAVAIFGVVLMSIESPLVKLSALSWANVSFTLGIALLLSTNIYLLSHGKKFFIHHYKVDYKGMLLCGVLMGLSNLTFIRAVIYAGVANTVLILASAPVISAILMWIFFRKKTSKTIFIVTAFIFLGLYIVLHKNLTSSSLLGVFFAFCCVVFMDGIYIALSHHKRSSKQAYISVTGLILSVFSAPFIDLEGSFYSFLIVFMLGLFSMPLSRYLLALGSKNLLPQEMSLILILESIIAPLFAWWWLDEKPTSELFIGGSIMIGSLIFYILNSNKKATI